MTASRKNWLITGVSSGLGKALAATALAAGDHVAGTVRSASARAAFEALAPGRAHGFVLELRDAAAIAEAVRSVESLFAIDVLVNNAGYGLTGAVEEVSLAESQAQFAVNLFAPLALIQAVLPGMRARRAGIIVNVTSVSGLATWQGTGLYCASKFALQALGETLADEVAPLGISVINVAPGGMRTDYASRSLVQAKERIADYDATAHESQRILAAHAGREPGDPARMARHIADALVAEHPPRNLLLGADAMQYATRRMNTLLAEIARLAPVSVATGFEE